MQKKEEKLRHLDLFSGIGGFSLALSSIVNTIAYCDNEPTCQYVLSTNISKKKLCYGKIFTDVRDMKEDVLKDIAPNIITAGFPCQDISAANPKGLGIKGTKSGLFKEILRIVDICDKTLQFIFLENSPRILKKGYTFVEKNMKKRGYVVKYCIIGAKDVGALHTRNRWYCLCYKPDMEDMLFKYKIAETSHTFKWASIDKYKRVLEKTTYEQNTHSLSRCKLLGNSIVPQCAAYAWNVLINQAKIIPKDVDLKLRFSDGISRAKSKLWATPCHSLWHFYTKITNRGIKTLASQMFYSDDTHIKKKRTVFKNYIPNPQFVECLMGFPRDWTKYKRILYQ